MAEGRLTLACQCGATFIGSAEPFSVAVDLSKAFWLLHRDPGHGPTTLQQAANARRRANCKLKGEAWKP